MRLAKVILLAGCAHQFPELARLALFLALVRFVRLLRRTESNICIVANVIMNAGRPRIIACLSACRGHGKPHTHRLRLELHGIQPLRTAQQ
ncbi:MAG: hypothetical protein PUF51_00340 [Bifidobacteriaceae bacterium]|nr:hypothetical protein [Bifidobacteriaceae bacterium]